MVNKIVRSVGGSVVRHLRRTLIAGLVLLVPVIFTYLILRLIFDFTDGILQPAIEAVVKREVIGLGIIVLVALVYLAGLVWANVLGRKMIGWAQGLLLRVPLAKAVYLAVKLLSESFSGQGPTGFNHVVTIEYPRIGTWTIGFLTAVTTDETGKSLGVVYIPTAPTPQSGWVALLPMDEIYDLDLTVPEAMRLVLSGGIITPPQIRKVRAPGG